DIYASRCTGSSDPGADHRGGGTGARAAHQRLGLCEQWSEPHLSTVCGWETAPALSTQDSTAQGISIGGESAGLLRPAATGGVGGLSHRLSQRRPRDRALRLLCAAM